MYTSAAYLFTTANHFFCQHRTNLENFVSFSLAQSWCNSQLSESYCTIQTQPHCAPHVMVGIGMSWSVTTNLRDHCVCVSAIVITQMDVAITLRKSSSLQNDQQQQQLEYVSYDIIIRVAVQQNAFMEFLSNCCLLISCSASCVFIAKLCTKIYNAMHFKVDHTVQVKKPLVVISLNVTNLSQGWVIKIILVHAQAVRNRSSIRFHNSSVSFTVQISHGALSYLTLQHVHTDLAFYLRSVPQGILSVQRSRMNKSSTSAAVRQSVSCVNCVCDADCY